MKKRLLLAIFSAVLLVLSFAPFRLIPLSWVALVPLFFALDGLQGGLQGGLKGTLNGEGLKSCRKKIFLVGWVWGVVFFLSTVYWVVYSMYYYGGVPFVLGVGVALLMSSLLAVYPAIFALLFARTNGLSPVARFFAIPFLWVFVEFLRATLFTGFPWELIGYSQTGYTTLIQSADIFGIWGVSFFVVAVNAGLYLIAKSVMHRQRGIKSVAVVCSILVVLVVAYGIMKPKVVRSGMSGGKVVKVTVVQGSIEQSVKWSKDKIKYTIDTYRDLSLKAVGVKEPGNAPEGKKLISEKSTEHKLIVWPETAMPFFLARNRERAVLVTDVAERSGAWLLTGAPHYEYRPGDDKYNMYNSAFLIDPEGEFAGQARRYDKMHLVPFGEYVPLKKILFFIEKLTEGAGDFVPGSGAVPLHMARADKDVATAKGVAPLAGNAGKNADRDTIADIGVLICYEAIFPEISAEFSNNGANLLVNITNDGWFGKTSAPYQHFDMTIMRAVENRVYLVRAANTGISAVVDPAGRVVSQTELFEKTTLSEVIRVRKNRPTFFATYPLLFPCLSIILSVIIILWSYKKRRR